MKRVIFFVLLVTFKLSGFADPVGLLYWVSDGNNRLYSIDRVTRAITNIGPTGVGNIEAIAYYPVPSANILYATDASTFGTIDLGTGAYTSNGQVDGGGTASGALGNISLNDVDGLMLDGRTFIMWASNRLNSSSDVIFQIDVTTGLFIPNAFGPGVDYIVIGGGGADRDVDDIAIDPTTGRMYATSNDGGSNDILLEINKFTATFSVQASLSQNDIEGIAFHNDGQLYGMDGNGNTFYEIALATGVMSNSTSLAGNGSDPESVAALVADANTVNGAVYFDTDLDGVRDGGELGVPNVTVYLYVDNDGDGLLDPEDTRVQTTATDANGDYFFYYASTANLITSTEVNTHPANHALTTDNIEALSFTDNVNFGEVSNNNNFGLGTGPDCDGDGLPNFFEGGLNSDADAILDSCDIDSDNDGILDSVEGIEDFDSDGIPNYRDRDSDDDGIPDAIEANRGSAPGGFSNAVGNVIGADADGNGMVDSRETAAGSGVMVSPNPDSDGDGQPDFLDLDSDNDGILDIVEAGSTDTDNDGQVDGASDANSNGYDDNLETTALAIPNTDAAYESGNGHFAKPNYIDIDSDNDGIDDTREGYSTAAYVFPTLLNDADNDGIIDIWDVSNLSSPITPNNNDGDSDPDYIDDDSDNDGISDFIEGNDANGDGVADAALTNLDADENGLDDAFGGNCQGNISLSRNDYGEQTIIGGNMDLGSSDLEFVDDGGDHQLVGLHYANIPLLANETVSSAYIQFEVDESESGAVTFTIEGESILNASTFTSADSNIFNRNRTTASVSWSPPDWPTVGASGVDQRSADISSIINELAAQSGWAEGNDIVIIISGPSSANIRNAENDPTLELTVAQTACSSTVAHQDFDGDGEDDFRDTDDDGDLVPTFSEQTDADGSGTVDYLEVDGGLCGFGFAPSSITTFTGSADALVSNNNVANATNILGAANGSEAQFYDNLDSVVIDLSDTLFAGFDYTITWSERTGESGTAAPVWEESVDGVNWTVHPTPPTTNSTTLTTTAITANVNTRFLKISQQNPPGNTDFEIDAITYSGVPACILDSDNDGVADDDDIDDDNDGIRDIDECASSTSYPATLQFTDGNVTNPNNLLGAPNTGVAEWNTNGDSAVYDFQSIRPKGTPYVVTWRSRSGGNAIPILGLSSDNSTYTSTNPISTTSTTLITDTVFAPVAFRYIYITKQSTPSIEDFWIDAIGTIATPDCDSDGDGIINSLDLDSDNDGIPDITEAVGTDANGDGRTDNITDTDGDGYTDQFDPNDGGTRPPNADTDGDGISNAFDLDSDNDGIPDIVESGREDTDGNGKVDDINGSNVLTNDADGNGWDNRYDQGSGGSGIPERDADNDGIADMLDLDSDNDGIPDVVEAGGTDANGDGRADNFADTDTDGFNDRVDGDVGNDGTSENSADVLIITGDDGDNDGVPDLYSAADNDGDGILNHLDLDADNDGIPDVVEAGGTDVNGDGRADAFADADGDGFNDVVDGDPDNSLAAGSDAADSNTGDALVLTGADGDNDGAPDTTPNDDNDGDGIYNFFDLDADNDGIPDVVEAGGTDVNGDGRADGFADIDGDGLNDVVDGDPDNSLAAGSDVADSNTGDALTTTGADGNGDGAPDSFPNDDNDGDDIYNFLDLDADNDGIPDVVEVGGTDTNGDGRADDFADTDSDGFNDVVDGDPNNLLATGNDGVGTNTSDVLLATGADTDGDGAPNSQPNDDVDGDAIYNHLDIDADNDGIVDAIEAGGTVDANGRLVGATTDTDNDGFGDSVDGDVGNDGTAENTGNALTATGGDTDNDGRPNSFPNDDADGDDRYNFQDIDADGDGIIDNIEGQISTSETEPNTTDANNDGLSDAFPNNGLTPVDTDSDGTPDYLDTDSDNDGFVDAIEGWDTDGDNVANTTPSGTDTDGDGLDNAFDLEPTASNTDNPANNGQDADQFPNGDNSGTPELDWREAQDTDGDGIADNVDLDVDNDGIPNSTENNGQNPYGDEDGDGIPNFLDTTDNGNGGDGSTTNYTDANGDGTPDIYDTDLDGVPDFLDLDSDNDGITDLEEADGGNVLTDANGDGRIDGPITDADNDGYHDPLDNEDGNQVAQGSEVESGTPLTNPNTDGRGNPNYLDIDADDDGITDLVESQATTGTPLIPTGTDTDGDGIDDRFDVDCAPCGGITGTAIVPVNTDGADTPDYIDTNSDNDGESDFIEANDANDDGVADVTINATDTDGDGLLDIFTDGVAVGVTTNPHNNGQDANDFPDHDGGASERDWREQPCAGGVATLAPDNATTSATASCKDGDWTYYYNPGDPTELLFAIEKQPSGGGANTNDFEVEVSITTSPNPQITSGVYSRENVGIPQATFVMGRYWNLNITSGSLNGTVNTRFFYRTAELNQMVSTANAWNTANAGGTSFTSGTRFFTMDNGTFDHTTGDLTTAGITDAFEITSTTAGVEDGVTFVEFNNVPALTGGGIAFTVNNNSVILPVELTKFDAEKDEANRAVNVTWETATEINNDYFEVQRSATGRDGEYEVIATVKGQGNSTVIHNYETVDQNPLNGTSYYRLNQVDFDGTATLSDAVAMNFETKAISSSGITAFPNPFGDKVTLRLDQLTSTATSSLGTAKMIVVTDATGRPVYSTEMPAGAQNIELPLDELSNGLYQINVTTESGVVTLPVVRGR